jgi:hypothetical protein
MAVVDLFFLGRKQLHQLNDISDFIDPLVSVEVSELDHKVLDSLVSLLKTKGLFFTLLIAHQLSCFKHDLGGEMVLKVLEWLKVRQRCLLCRRGDSQT